MPVPPCIFSRIILRCIHAFNQLKIARVCLGFQNFSNSAEAGFRKAHFGGFWWDLGVFKILQESSTNKTYYMFWSPCKPTKNLVLQHLKSWELILFQYFCSWRYITFRQQSVKLSRWRCCICFIYLYWHFKTFQSHDAGAIYSNSTQCSKLGHISFSAGIFEVMDAILIKNTRGDNNCMMWI